MLKHSRFFSSESPDVLLAQGLSLLQSPSTHSIALQKFTSLKEKVSLNQSIDSICCLLEASLELHHHSYKTQSEELLSQSLYFLGTSPKALDELSESNFQGKLTEALYLISDPLTSFIIETLLNKLQLFQEWIDFKTLVLCEAAALEAKCFNFERSSQILEKVKELNEFLDFLSFSAIWVVLTEGKICVFKKDFEMSINLYSKAQHTFFLKSFDPEMELFLQDEQFKIIDSAVYAKLHENLMELYLEKSEYQEASKVGINIFKWVKKIGNLELTQKIARKTMKNLLETKYLQPLFLNVLEFCEQNSLKNEFSCFVYKVGVDISEKANDIENCMKYIQKIVDVSQETRLFNELFEAYISAASLYVEIDSKRLEKILKLAESVALTHEVQVNKLNFYLLYFKLHEDKKEPEKCLKIIEKILDYPRFFQLTPEIILKYLKIFNVFFKSNQNYRKSLEINKKILEYFITKDNLLFEKCEIFELISENYRDLNDLNNAAAFLEKSIEISYDLAFKDMEKLTNRTLKFVSILETLGDFLKSIRFISRLEQYLGKTFKSEDLGNLYLKAGIFHIQVKNFKESEKYLKLAQSIFSSLFLFDELKETSRLLRTFEPPESLDLRY